MIEEIQIGDLIYRPVIDLNVGFAIEEISVIKLIGPSKNPYGFSWLKWTYGNVSFLKERQELRDGSPTFFLKKDCYRTIEECIDFLEKKRLDMISFQKDKREQVLAEVIEAQNFLRETKKESLELSRLSNKNVAMLNKLDIKRDLERKGLIED